MNQGYAPVEVKVWADYACFTRPEMKVERVSYPVPTPTAARGVLEAIFWKPEFRWQIEEIQVLKEIRYASILRNEVNSRASERAVAGWQRLASVGMCGLHRSFTTPYPGPVRRSVCHTSATCGQTRC